LFYYDPLRDRLTRKITYSQYKWTAGIFIDNKDILYIMNPLTGVNAYDIKLNKLYLTACRFKTPYADFVASGLTTDFKNSIWLKSPDNNGLFFFNTRTNEVKYYKNGFKFRSVFYVNAAKLYFLDNAGRLLITDTTIHVEDKIKYTPLKNKTLSITAISRDDYHRIWISTVDNGLICYDERTNIFTGYLHDNSLQKSLPINMLPVLCIDHSGNLWVGTDGGGVCKLDLKPPRFNLFPLNEGDYPFLKDYFIKCLYEDEMGRIWFGTVNNGLNIYDPVTKQIKNYNYKPGQAGGLPGPMVSCIFKDREGLIWVCTSLGLAVFNERNGTFIPVNFFGAPKLNEHNNFVYKLIELKNGNLLAATFYGLMLIKRAGNIYTGYFSKNHAVFTDVAEMSDHTLWASSPVNGLFHFKKAGNNFVLIERTLPLIDLRSIHQDECDENTLWICTGIGLIKFNTLTQKQTIYDEKSGMANSYVYGVLEDEQHNFWMSTNMGLIFFNRGEGTFQNYTVKDGLQSNEFNTQAFYKGASGCMYFGGIKGFNWFNPKSIKTEATTLPGVAITSIKIDDEPYVKDNLFISKKTLSMQYNQSSISFGFAALDFTRPQANKVKFILEGWDKNWIVSGDKNMRYTHLTPAQYILRVKAANSNGVWSKEEKLVIIVNAPFWQKTWFYVCAAITLLAIIVYITFYVSRQKIKKRLRQLEKQAAIDAERNRISRDMHDEIGSGLTHIALLSELIQTQQKTERTIKNDLGSISIAARKLVESMSEIIWALNPQNDSLENLLSYIREQMQQLFEPFKIALTINFPDEVPRIKLSNEQRRNLYLVTKEALNNVMKHADAKHVELSLRPGIHRLNFEVSDDGHGMQSKTPRLMGNGLKNMRKRMEDIGGTIEWINQQNGLKVVYTLNVR
jgi:signal transduction histidine kinase